MEYYDAELAKRFVSDYKLPIQLIEPNYFFYFLKLYEKDFLSLTKYKSLCHVIKEQFSGSPKNFLDYYYQIRDTIIQTIENNKAFQMFNNMDMSKYSINKKENISSNNIYKENNIGKVLISIDLQKANYQALKYVNNDIVLGTDTYDEFIHKFTELDYIAESKYTRQVIFGKLNPKRHITVERYIIHQVYEFVVNNFKLHNCISITNDELIFEIKKEEIDDYNSIIKEIQKSIKDNLGFLTKVELYTLYGVQLSCDKFKRSCYYYKAYANNINKLMCVPVNYYAIVYKLFNSIALCEEDYHFDYEGLDCRYCESFNIEKIESNE